MALMSHRPITRYAFLKGFKVFEFSGHILFTYLGCKKFNNQGKYLKNDPKKLETQKPMQKDT